MTLTIPQHGALDAIHRGAWDTVTPRTLRALADKGLVTLTPRVALTDAGLDALRIVPFHVSPFIEFEASGSEISNPTLPDEHGQYDRRLREQFATCSRGMLHLTRTGLLDLAEWLDAMSNANAQNGNPSGAASCAKHAERALAAARAIP